MPLLDHSRPPLSRTHPWRGFHGAWAAAMARLLNAGVLPAGYYTVPSLDREGPIEIDVAALREFDPAATETVTQPWRPDAPAMSVAVEWPTADEVRVEILADEGDPDLAAVELVSPSHKDRPKARVAFAAKYAASLRKRCGLVVVDVVTTRRADLRADLFAALGIGDGSSEPAAMSAVSYHATGREEDGRLLAWPMELRVGEALPTVPLWLGEDLAVPLDPEASHRAACEDLRIRDAG